MVRNLFALTLLVLSMPVAFADLVQLTNGDRVSGEIIEVNGVNVVVVSPVMGNIKLLRADVRAIRFGSKEQIEAGMQAEHKQIIQQATKQALAEAAKNKPAEQTDPDKLAAAHQAIAQPAEPAKANDPAQFQKAMKNAVGPEQDLDFAVKQLKGMLPNAITPQVEGRVRNQLGGILSGDINLMDIRNQAADASRQLRSMKKDLKGLGAWNPTYDMYLGILDNFVERADAGETLE